MLDPQFDAHITPADRVRALDRLALLSDQAIGNAVAGPPDEWGITSERRIALAAYLSSRRDTLILLRGV